MKANIHISHNLAGSFNPRYGLWGDDFQVIVGLDEIELIGGDVNEKAGRGACLQRLSEEKALM
jgi:hypothetical protein